MSVKEGVVEMVKIIDLRRWLAIGALVLLTSLVSVAKPMDSGKKGCEPRDKHCKQVPDGGSPPAYLLIAASACLGGMVVRARLNKTRLS